jgi:hypothetical protein
MERRREKSRREKSVREAREGTLGGGRAWQTARATERDYKYSRLL